MAKRKGEGGTIVLKRIEEGGHGHHGGAWKVAYADFVTAMMAFFLLMWLLNATTEEQRRGIADYFNPTNVLASGQSGSGQPFGGATPHSPSPMASDGGQKRVERGPRPVTMDIEEEEETTEPPERVARRDGPPGPEDTPQPRTAEGREGTPGEHAPEEPGTGPNDPNHLARLTDEALQAELARREQVALEQAAEALREALRQDPNLGELGRQLRVEVVPEGLRIQLLEADGVPMFATGGAAPTDRARQLIRRVAEAAARLPNPITITGHTDSTPFRQPGRTNWDLSAERANATRRLLQEAGVGDARLRGVTGMADREPLLPDQPAAAGNRRVAITLLRQSAEAPPPNGAPR
jgi:chemotaxis protein MotB